MSKILIAEFPGHPKGYGFTADLTQNTSWGIPNEELEKYENLREEWEHDPALPPHIVNLRDVPYTEIQRGTLRIYGETL